MHRRSSVMFHELAPYYDLYLADKNYRSECRRLESLARRYGRSRGRTWLDVGCGTGRHLEYLRRRHSVAGVDLSPEMLRAARHRLPRVSFVRGDARTFQVGRTFDVVTCLFGVLGHIDHERDVQRVFRRIAAHVAPGGIAIVEPWIVPSQYRPGFIHLMTHDSPSIKAVRLAYSTRRGNRLVVRCHYLVARKERPILHYEEVALGLMVPPARLIQLMESAGLRAHYLARGLNPGRGLLIGVQGKRSSRPSGGKARVR